MTHSTIDTAIITKFTAMDDALPDRSGFTYALYASTPMETGVEGPKK